MRAFSADVRYALRLLVKSPRFSLVAIAALALGIGANAAIFSVVNVVLLRPLPFPEPDRLVQICRQFQTGTGCSTSIPKFMTWRRAESFVDMAAYDFAGPGMNVSGGGRSEQVRGIHVSAGYFRVFGAAAASGRTFTAEEDRPGGPRVVVLSHQLWMTRFGSDPAKLGRTIALNGDSYEVVGILAQDFRPQPPADVFIPLQPDPNSTNQGHFLSVAGRLKSGASIERARAEMKVLGEQFRRGNPQWMSTSEEIAVRPMQDLMVQDVRPALRILLGAVGLVLLIACANVASLLLARAAGRQKEVAIRAAIGASRWVIVRQLLAESLLLSTVGAIVGLIFGVWGARTLLVLSPGNLPRTLELAESPLLQAILDWRLIGFTATISFITGIIFGLAPALHLAQTDLGVTLKEGGGRGATGARATRTRAALVVAEIALAFVLLVGATLLVRTFIELRQVNAGLDPDGVLTFQTSLAGGKYSTSGAVERLVRTVTERIEAVPGVVAAAATMSLPTDVGMDLPFSIEGRALQGTDRFHGDEQWRAVSSGYFEALGIPLVRGRGFDERDSGGAAPVLIVNATMAKKFWPDADPIGQRLVIGKGLGPEFEDPPRQIIGVVGDVRETGLSEGLAGVMYVPGGQLSDGLTKLAYSVLPMGWIVRATSTQASLTTMIEREFSAVDPLLATSNVRTMAQVLSGSIAQQNFNMLLLTIFGAMALVLAGIGVYGLMAYSVEQSTHDIGVRMALGADRADIRALVVWRGMRLAGLGLGVGVLAALGAVRLVARLLFGVRPLDPATFVIVLLTLGAVAFFACYLPARRAMAVDPILALRDGA
jgi:putative ABC transport system permease protein